MKKTSEAFASVNQLLAKVSRLCAGFGRRQCLLCLGYSSQLPYALCPSCDRDLPRLSVSCRQCSLPLAATPDRDERQLLCGRCLTNPPDYDRCIAALEYRWPAEVLIPQLKYSAKLAHVHLLAALMLEALLRKHDAQTWPDVLVPVPLHWHRQANRGFNQSSLLAKSVERQLKVQFENLEIATRHVLAKRHKSTPSQAGQSADQRRINMRDAFVIQSQKVPKSVAIVDDVVTTGATVNELARQLKVAGVEHVEVWCIARTPAPI